MTLTINQCVTSELINVRLLPTVDKQSLPVTARSNA
jgi:hypothetical protein